VVVWGLIASLFIGNALLLVLNLPLIRFWVLLLKIPSHYLYAGITTFALLGAYALNNSTFDLQVALAIGILGYLFRRFGVPVTPLIIGLILGPLAETQFKRALQISQGDYSILIAGGFPKIIYAILILVVVAPLIWNFKKTFAVKK
jgi:putative tricarboxylic transport membrane protein